MKKKVLVVDDSRFIWEEMKRCLEDTDFEIAGYSSCGENAISVYEDCLPDVVTMDIIMPGMDGLEATRRLLGKWPDAKVIMLTSLAYDETKGDAQEVGALGFLFKPFGRQELIASLMSALGMAELPSA